MNFQNTFAMIAGAPLDTTTTRPDKFFSLSSQREGEGWGEEATFIEFPSPHSFLAGRGRRFLMPVSRRCALTAVILLPLIMGRSQEAEAPNQFAPMPPALQPAAQPLSSEASFFHDQLAPYGQWLWIDPENRPQSPPPPTPPPRSAAMISPQRSGGRMGRY